MKFKVYFLILLLIVSILTACNNKSGSGSADWSDQFIVWKGNLYVVSNEKLSQSELETELGKVDKFLSNETNIFDMSHVYSNQFSENTVFYKIVNVAESESLAVKQGSILTKLNNTGKYGE